MSDGWMDGRREGAQHLERVQARIVVKGEGEMGREGAGRRRARRVKEEEEREGWMYGVKDVAGWMYGILTFVECSGLGAGWLVRAGAWVWAWAAGAEGGLCGKKSCTQAGEAGGPVGV